RDAGRARIVEHGGLAGGYALFRRGDFDVLAGADAQLRRCGRACGAHAHEDIAAVVFVLAGRRFADPVDLLQRNAGNAERFPRPDDDALMRSVELHDEERLARSDAQAAALTDGEVDDAVVRPNDAAV